MFGGRKIRFQVPSSTLGLCTLGQRHASNQKGLWHVGLEKQFPAPLQAHRAGAQLAQIVMQPEFYDKKLEKMDFLVSLIGEVLGHNLANPVHSKTAAHHGAVKPSSEACCVRPLDPLRFPVVLIPEVGGAYGIAFTAFFSLYVLVWNLENVYWKRAPEAQVAQVPTPVAPAGKVAEEDDVERAVL